MEAPVITPIPIGEEKKVFTDQIDGQNYIISLEKTEYKDYIVLKIKNDLNEYCIKYNRQEISSIIKEFQIFSDINDIYDTLSDIINNHRYKIQNNNDNLTFKIKICKMSGNEEEYDLVLNSKPITQKRLFEKINNLSNKVTELENIVNQQNKKIDEQNNLIKNYESKLNSQAEMLTKYNERIMSLENFLKPVKNENKFNYFNNSNIIKSEDDIGFLINRLEFNGKIKNFELLYSVTKNGGGPNNFHNKCDNINNTLIVIKTNKNCIFGGFTSAKWDMNTGEVKDEKAFCFSLNNKKIYNIIKDKTAIFCAKGFGPSFGSSPSFSIYLYDNLLSKQQYTCKKSDSFYDGLSMDYELNNGEEYFFIKELEIYKIQFH